MTPKVTLLDLVSAVSEFAHSEAEVIATVVYMVNSGSVRLGGSSERLRCGPRGGRDLRPLFDGMGPPAR